MSRLEKRDDGSQIRRLEADVLSRTGFVCSGVAADLLVDLAHERSLFPCSLSPPVGLRALSIEGRPDDDLRFC